MSSSASIFHNRFVQGASFAMAVMGVTGLVIYKDAAIKLLGGHTTTEMDKLRGSVSTSIPDYTFNRFRNISLDDCMRAIDLTLKNHAQSITFWSGNLTDTDRRGASFTIQDDDGVPAYGSIACHFERLYDHPDGEYAVLMSSLASPFESFEANEVENGMFDRFRSMLPSHAVQGLPPLVDWVPTRGGAPVFTYNCENYLSVRFDDRLGELQRTTREIDLGSLLLDADYDPVCNYQTQETQSASSDDIGGND